MITQFKLLVIASLATALSSSAANSTLYGRAVLNLSGPRWQMEGIRPGQGVREGFQEHYGEVASSFYNWNGAEVPGDVYTDLWRAGEIEDPHYGRNGLRAKWVMEKEWWYRCQFAVPEKWKGRVVRVVFEGVDYSGEVWLNGHYLGRHEGMFSPFEFDVGAILRYGDNRRANGLVVKLDPPPRAYRKVAGRKFGWHGDYWRAITPFGIWKPIKLVATGPLRIVDIYPKSKIHPDGSATVNVEVTVAGEAAGAKSGARVSAVIRGLGFEAGPYHAETTLALERGSAIKNLSIRVPNAKLWWPWELGEPNRYTVEVSVFADRLGVPPSGGPGNSNTPPAKAGTPNAGTPLAQPDRLGVPPSGGPGKSNTQPAKAGTPNAGTPLAQPDRFGVPPSGGPGKSNTPPAKAGTPSGVLSDHTTTTFGIREIRMERNPGFTEEEVRNPWTFVINGKRMFIRSGSWGGPPDIFYGRNSLEKYRKLIQLARAANLNNLRIFGWHPTEVDAFYDLCDEFGITVWQDLIPLASVRLPEDEAFRKATYAEAVAVIKNLRRHPCLIMLEGGEEMFFGTQGLEYTADFLIGLGKAIQPYTGLPYVATSPLNWPPILHQLGLGGPKDSAHTHFLFYTMGARLLEDYIAEWDYAVVPEFGVSSAPNVASIRKFIPPDELWPPGPSWGYHWADLDTFRALNFQVLGDERTGSLEQFVEATQISQGTIFQWGIEHMRRRKPKSSAIAICHFITWAPDMKWGIVDYFQVPKRSYDFVRRACQPLLVSLKCDKRRWLPGETFQAEIWLVNDLHRQFENGTLTIQVTDPQGHQLAARNYPITAIAPDSSRRFTTFEWPITGKTGGTFKVTADLRSAEGRGLSDNHYLFLLADQVKARKECAARAARWQALKARFPTADYYRFYPELSGPEHAKTFGTQTPRATTKIDFP